MWTWLISRGHLFFQYLLDTDMSSLVFNIFWSEGSMTCRADTKNLRHHKMLTTRNKNLKVPNFWGSFFFEGSNKWSFTKRHWSVSLRQQTQSSDVLPVAPRIPQMEDRNSYKYYGRNNLRQTHLFRPFTPFIRWIRGPPGIFLSFVLRRQKSWCFSASKFLLTRCQMCFFSLWQSTKNVCRKDTWILTHPFWRVVLFQKGNMSIWHHP